MEHRGDQLLATEEEGLNAIRKLDLGLMELAE